MDHVVVSREQWLAARQELLANEKELTRHRDEVNRLRRNLPWTKVEQEYEFDGEAGKTSLCDLFGDCSQLIVYHFMFDPMWTEGCKSCSLLADTYQSLGIHLQHRDVAMVTVSRAPLDKLLAFRQRMEWNFPWVSSHASDFNQDFGVTFTEAQIEQGDTFYNFERNPFPITEAPGISVFAREDGQIYHTYSAYARGLDMLMGIYHFLDLVPKGRDEQDLVYSMEWVRHHDRYGDDTFVDPYVQLMTPD
ncbi:MAG: thioredoxin family protein [Planctomycetota bacterium]